MIYNLGNIFSYNADGLGTPEKRKTVLKWLKSHAKGIMCIQESHSTIMNESCWTTFMSEHYKIYFAHGESNSRGVVTIIPQKLVKYVNDTYMDSDGRLLIIHFIINKVGYTLCNVYGPCQDKPNDQIAFIDSVNSKMLKYPNSKLILAGDFNIIQDPTLDKWNPAPNEKPGKPAIHLDEFKTSHDLVDIWRLHNPHVKRYTWRRKRVGKPPQQSRIDYCLVSDTLINVIEESDILPGFRSDHSLVTISINNIEAPNRGRGYWKFNNELLKDETYKSMIEINFQNGVYQTEFSGDPALDWDALKMMMRRDTISYAIRKTKRLKEYSNQLSQNLEKADKEFCNSSVQDSDKAEEYFTMKAEWQAYQNSKTAGARLRSKARWVEEGEKNTKYFLNLEKHNQEKKTISSIINSQDQILNAPKDIMDEITGFYKKLYSEDNNVNNLHYNCFTSNVKIAEDDYLEMEKALTIDECKNALDQMPVNKSPGSDGFTAEFYKSFWPLLKDHFYACLKDVIARGELSADQRTGIITLIPKGDKDIRYVKNWRPISLLNVDYKIIAKALANRLKPILPDIIHMDQNAYVKNRLIGYNIRIVDDLIDFCTLVDMDGLLLLLDFEKAFDSISWEFLTHTLEQFGFGPNAINYFKLLYNNIQSHVASNGHLSRKFDLYRGIRQGCPASAFLFIMCVELLAQKIRTSDNIEGLNINDHIFKIIQFADDTALILQNKKSIFKAFDVIDLFYRCSGLKLNKSKSELFRLGNKPCFDVKDLNLKWVQSFRYLGVYYSTDLVDQEYKNYRHRLDNIRNMLKIWLQRDLSLKGKVTVIRTLAMSQLIFPLSMTYAPEWVTKEAESLFYKFLWNNKKDKISRTTVIRQINEGGLKMIDADCMARALKTKWMSNLTDPDNKDHKWTVIPKLFFDCMNLYDFCACNYDLNMIPPYIPRFYKQALIGLSELRNVDPSDALEICNQSIWYNRNITLNRKPLFYKHWYSKGVFNIGDILAENNKFMKFEDIKKLFGLKDKHFLEYINICKCVPPAWRRLLYEGKDNHEGDSSLSVYIRGEATPVENCPNRLLYLAFTDLKCTSLPNSYHIWDKILGIEHDNMSEFFMVPFKYVRDCAIQSMQYKILNNIYITNLRLFQWRRIPSEKCDHCGSTDTLTHHFFECDKLRGFWKGLTRWMFEATDAPCELSASDILLGIIDNTTETTNIN
jgi:exonuclease III